MHITFESLERRELFAAGPVVISMQVRPRLALPENPSVVITVRYRDLSGIDASSFDQRDVRVAGPLGFARYARAVDSTSNVLGTERTVRYKIATPSLVGKYTVTLRGGEIFDIDGNAAGPRVLGHFAVPAVATGSDVFIRAFHRSRPEADDRIDALK